jgi:hypothetical protein
VRKDEAELAIISIPDDALRSTGTIVISPAFSAKPEVAQENFMVQEKSKPAGVQYMMDSLSVRLKNSLRNHFDRDVSPEKLSNLTKEEFLRIPCVGRVALAELRAAFAANGIQWPPQTKRETAQERRIKKLRASARNWRAKANKAYAEIRALLDDAQ